MLGALLIGVSVWGISLCRGIFRAYVGPGSVPGDSLFASLGTWATWVLFFAPLGIGGVALVWSTLHKMDAIYEFASWMADRAGPPNAVVVNPAQFGGIVRGGTPDDPHGLESLGPETVERLQRTAARTATILGGLAGAFLLAVGIFGLSYLLFLSYKDLSNSIYGHFEVGRAMFAFALFSGMLVFLGFIILQRTFRMDNSGWLLPLRLFTYLIVRRRAGERTGLARQQQPGAKQHPKV